MNILSSLLLFIGQQLTSTKNRTRDVIPNARTVDKIFYGVYGFVGASNTAYICIPANIASNITSFKSISVLKCSLRTVTGGYLGGASNIDLTSSITASSVSSDQPLLRITVQNSSFGAAVQHTPIAGNVTMQYELQ